MSRARNSGLAGLFFALGLVLVAGLFGAGAWYTATTLAWPAAVWLGLTAAATLFGAGTIAAAAISVWREGDGDDVRPAPVKHRASCHGPVGELQCEPWWHEKGDDDDPR